MDEKCLLTFFTIEKELMQLIYEHNHPINIEFSYKDEHKDYIRMRYISDDIHLTNDFKKECLEFSLDSFSKRILRPFAFHINRCILARDENAAVKKIMDIAYEIREEAYRQHGNVSKAYKFPELFQSLDEAVREIYRRSEHK